MNHPKYLGSINRLLQVPSLGFVLQVHFNPALKSWKSKQIKHAQSSVWRAQGTGKAA